MIDQVEEGAAEQAFFTDVLSISVQVVKSWYYMWPSHTRLIESMREDKFVRRKIQYSHIRSFLPDWDSKRAKLAFFDHYSRLLQTLCKGDEALFAAAPLEDALLKQVRTMLQDTERAIAVMLGVPLPSQGERLKIQGQIKKIQGQIKKKKTKRYLHKSA